MPMIYYSVPINDLQTHFCYTHANDGHFSAIYKAYLYKSGSQRSADTFLIFTKL